MICYDMLCCFKKQNSYITVVLIIDSKDVKWEYFKKTSTTSDVLDYVKGTFQVSKAKLISVNEIQVHNQCGILGDYLKKQTDTYLTLKIHTYK